MPLYESKKDRRNERRIAEKVADRWGVHAKKLPPVYPFDFAFCDFLPHKNKSEQYPVKAFAEVKKRNNKSTDYGTYMIGLDKLIEGNRLKEMTDKMAMIIVEFDDGIFYYEVGPAVDVSIGGRYDRADKNDQSPMAHIPTNNLTKIV